MSIVKETKKFENQNFYENNMYLPVFPEFIDGEISSEDFIVATKQLVKTLDYFGKIFMPVKFDMQGNIDKLTKKFNLDRENNSTLQKMIIRENHRNEKPVATDALLWLRRGLHMIQLFFEYLVADFESGKGSEDVVAVLKKAYKMTLEPYHGYVAQQLFGLLSKKIPTRSQIFRAISNGYEIEEKILVKNLERFSKRLKDNVKNLKEFYDEHDLESSLKHDTNTFVLLNLFSFKNDVLS